MPARLLPVTDAARLQALETAAGKAAAVGAGPLAFSAATKTTLDATLPQFRTELQERGVALGAQVAATTALTAQRGRLRTYVSHFLQQLNMAIARGVLTVADRAFFQIPTSQESLPRMTSEAELLMWSQRIADGEAARVTAGGTALPFPSATEVTTERTAYVTLQADQSTKKDALDAEQEDVDAMRAAVDGLILDIWDEVEFTFRKESASSARANAREYGVVYVSRPGEPTEPGQPPPPPATPVLTQSTSGQMIVEIVAVEGATAYKYYRQEVGVDADFILHETSSETTSVINGLTLGNTLRVYVTSLNNDGESQPSTIAEHFID